MRAPCRAFPFGKGPKQGDVVTFEYDSFSRAGLPVNPVIYRIRTDVEWEEIASQSVEQLNLNGTSPPLSTPLHIVPTTGSARGDLYLHTNVCY